MTCKKCNLHKLCGGQVPGEGSNKLGLMLIGEAPGHDEDIQKRPFVGDAGKVLDRSLQEAGIRREDVFITNICQCRPPNNRPPEDIEIKACREYWQKEVTQQSPKVLMPLGNVALEVITGTRGISKKRGIPKRLENGVICLPTFHPAYILRNPGEHWKLVLDLKHALNILNGKNVTALDYRVITDFDKVVKFLKFLNDRSKFSFDLETTSTRLLKLHALGIGFSWERGHAAYIPLNIVDNEEVRLFQEWKVGKVEKYKPAKIDSNNLEVKSFWTLEQNEVIQQTIVKLFNNPSKKTAHNAKFDCNILWREFDIDEVSNLTLDTQIGSYLLDENRRQDLKSLAMARYDDLIGYDSEIQEYLGITDYRKALWKAPVDIVGRYCCGDADACYRLAFDIGKELSAQKPLLKLYNSYYLPMIQVLSEMERTGLLIDTNYVMEKSKEYEDKITQCLAELSKSIGKEININSPKQMKELFFSTLKLKPVKKTKKGFPSVDKDSLELIVQKTKNPIAKMVSEGRHLIKIKATYFDGFMERLDIDGRIRSSLNSTGTPTSRLSSSDPNLQNISTDNEIRRMIIAQGGWSLLRDDYTQAELRVLAWYSGDARLVDACHKNLDMHKRTASLFYHVDLDKVTQKMRKDAKTLNFAIIYGQTLPALAASLGVSIKEAEILYNQFFKELSGVKKWIDSVKMELHKNRQVVNAYGLIRRFHNIDFSNKHLNEYEIAEAERKAVNFNIQSSTHQYLGFGLIRTQEVLKRMKVRTRLLIEIHDSAFFECPDKEISTVSPVIKKCFEDPVFPIDIPMRMDEKISKRWEEEEKT